MYSIEIFKWNNFEISSHFSNAVQAIQYFYKNAIKRLCRLLLFMFAANLAINWANHLNKSTMPLADCIGINFHCTFQKCCRFSLLAPKNQLYFVSLEVFLALVKISKMFVNFRNNSLRSLRFTYVKQFHFELVLGI